MGVSSLEKDELASQSLAEWASEFHIWVRPKDAWSIAMVKLWVETGNSNSARMEDVPMSV